MPDKEKTRSFLNNFIEANVLLTLFCLPFSKSVVELCVILAIVAFLIKKILIDRRLSIGLGRGILIPLILFVLFNLLSIFHSQYLNLSIHAFFSKVLKWAVFFIAIAETIKRPAQLQRLFKTMLFSCGLILVDGIYQQYVTGKDFLHYPSGYPVFKFHARKTGGMSFPTASFPYPNDFASWINVYLFTFVGLMIFDLKEKSKQVYKIITAILCAFLAYFLFLTQASSAMIGSAISMGAILLINLKKFLLPIAVILLVIILITSFVPYLRDYLQNGILDKALSINDRVGMWATGWEIFKNHPIMGNGVNTFFEHFKNYRNDEDKGKHGSYAHNCFLQMAADIGIFGLLSFLCFVSMVLYPNFRRSLDNISGMRNSFVVGLSLGVLAFLIHSFFDTNLYSLNLLALFWVSMGLICGLGSVKDEA